MRVAAVIPTRGDVDLTEIVSSIPAEWDIFVWANGSARQMWTLTHFPPENRGSMPPTKEESHDVPSEFQRDLSVYGRYAAIEYAEAPIIYTQDDDVILDPESFVTLREAYQPGVLTANMPQEFRHDFYQEHCLVGFGAIFDRHLPQQAFDKYFSVAKNGPDDPLFRKNCDVVFTALSTRHWVDVPKRNLPWCNDDNRMWKQPNHQTSRSRTLQLALQAR